MLTRTATDSVWYGCLFSSYGESRAKHNLTEPTPLQVEHMALEFIVEPFRPSGPCLRTMKISAQWCRVDTSYFTHNWETRRGRERLLSRMGPLAHCPDHMSSLSSIPGLRGTRPTYIMVCAKIAMGLVPRRRRGGILGRSQT